MPPRIPRSIVAQSGALKLSIVPRSHQICLICSLSQSSRPRKKPRAKYAQQQRIPARQQSNAFAVASTATSLNPRSKSSRAALRDSLLDLQKNAGSYVNISRLQLALRGLEQDVGDETIRIAILGLADGGRSLRKARDLVKLLVADPLKTEEEWERLLAKEPPGGRPMLLKIGHQDAEETVHENRLVQEIHVSSPVLNGHKLEILVLEMDPPKAGDEGAFNEAVLVPTMEIPTSSTGRYTPVTTPVHKSLVVGDGIMGATSISNYSLKPNQSIVNAAVDFTNGAQLENETLPFQVIDVALAEKALGSFRQSVNNALLYEENWFKTGLPEILDWARDGTAPVDGSMKQPLRKLMESLLKNTEVAIEAERHRQLNAALTAKVSALDLMRLQQELNAWAERAHTELRDELDIAFNGKRWRKLGWWKLFWRVDDVSMISTDILNQRFLIEAEKELIFLAGRVVEAGTFNETRAVSSTNWAHRPETKKLAAPRLLSEPPPPVIRDLVKSSSMDHLPIKSRDQPWPLHIPATRTYLVQDTVPALQALAQKLVLQTLSTSSLATAFGGLVYFSSVSNTVYEAGAVAALGIVFSLRRMQGEWEAARRFWEGEVREEGRKAVRGVEGTVNGVLNAPEEPLDIDDELSKVSEVVQRAGTALENTK